MNWGNVLVFSSSFKSLSWSDRLVFWYHMCSMINKPIAIPNCLSDSNSDFPVTLATAWKKVCDEGAERLACELVSEC